MRKSRSERPARGAGARPAKPHSSRDDLFDPKSRVLTGHHAIREALTVRRNNRGILAIESRWESSQDLREIVELAEKQGLQVKEMGESFLSRYGRHQGAVLAITHRVELDWDQLLQKKSAIVLALDGVEDPHNLGAVMRTAWLMGASAILVSEDRTVTLTASVHKVASGGAEHVPVVPMVQFTAALQRLKENGFWVFGLSHKTKSSLFELKIPEKVVWCLGGEDRGLRGGTEKSCDQLVQIPQRSAAASYNLSVSAAIALAETRRQNLTHSFL